MSLNIYIVKKACLFLSAGVLAQENLPKDAFARGSSYIAASYVKFLESAGARVAPIRWGNRSHNEKNSFIKIKTLFNLVFLVLL